MILVANNSCYAFLCTFLLYSQLGAFIMQQQKKIEVKYLACYSSGKHINLANTVSNSVSLNDMSMPVVVPSNQEALYEILPIILSQPKYL